MGDRCSAWLTSHFAAHCNRARTTGTLSPDLMMSTAATFTETAFVGRRMTPPTPQDCNMRDPVATVKAWTFEVSTSRDTRPFDRVLRRAVPSTWREVRPVEVAGDLDRLVDVGDGLQLGRDVVVEANRDAVRPRLD